MVNTSFARHAARRLIVTLCLSLVLAACGSPPPPPRLRIASSPWPGYEPLYLARDLGFLDEDRVSLFELPSADVTMESFRNHSADLATLTLNETLELLDDGMAVKILHILDISNGGDAVMAAPHIKTLADLKGKRISIVNISLGFYMLNRLLDKAGLERSDVEVFTMSDSKQVSFYEQGKADVVITFEPIKSRLAQKGLHVLFDSSDTPNEIFGLLVVHDNVYQARRAEICDVVRQWYTSLEYIQAHKQDAASRISQRLGTDAKNYDAMMAGLILPTATDNQRLLGGQHPALVEPVKKLSRIMFNEKQLSHHVDISTAMDTTFSNCYQK